MALTSNDETDLLLPLYRGLMEQPLFNQFLKRLQRRTSAAHVSIIMRRNNALMRETDVSFVGQELMIRPKEPADHNKPDDVRLQRTTTRPYRVYTLAEMVESIPASNPWHTEALSSQGIADLRIVRIPINPNVSGVLTLARSSSCSAADSALLSNLTPYVETALTMLQAMERTRLETLLSAEGLTRSGTGWIVFDANVRILAIEAQTQRRLTQHTGIEPRVGGHIRAASPRTERKLAETAARFATDVNAPPDSAVFSHDPQINAVLTPVPIEMRDEFRTGPFPEAAMIAYCRFETDETSERISHLSRLFGLPAREAELAIALADGYSIAEAAAAMGLTLETARNYSKRLYAQLGVRGQTELVRLVHRSSTVLA